MAAPYLPSQDRIVKVARRAKLRNPHPDARSWLMDKVQSPPSDWDERSFLNVPGLVWTTSSDTCMTGHLSAPNNVAYDTYGREFVFRQPRNAKELAAIMSADSEEVFSCYRFDGVERWSAAGVRAWHDDMHVVLGWIDSALASSPSQEITDSLLAYRSHLDSDAFVSYLVAFEKALKARDATTAGATTRGPF